MKNDLLDINNFNIIQDEENYYFFRALNMADNNDVEQGITISKNGKIERIRTDRERYIGNTKYTKDSKISLEEMYDHIKLHYRKDTNCISITNDSNIAISYGRNYYKDKYVIIKIHKGELGNTTFVAGQYLLKGLYSKIEQTLEQLPEDKKKGVLEIFKEIDSSDESKTLPEMIKRRYVAKSEEMEQSKAHLRKEIKYSAPKSRISNYKQLNKEQLLEVNKVYAKLAILENKNELPHVIPYSSNSKFRNTLGRAFSSYELIHYGEIKQSEIIEVPKNIIYLFALLQQEQKNKEHFWQSKIEELKYDLITEIKKRYL